MQLPRHGQLDDRRRRVLTEEVIGSSANLAEPAADEAGGSAGSSGSRRRRTTHHARSYGDDVLIDRQPRVTDLVPHRYSILALALLGGLAVVAGLEAAYLWLPELSSMTSDGRLAAIDLEGEGALASWFSSTTLALAAVVAAIIFSVRRHRNDDYHGRYRVWLWAAALWMLMSVDEGASLHEGFKELASHFSGQRGFGDGSIWWIAAYALVFATVGTRLFLDMRCCRLSSATLVLAVGCYVAAVVAKIGVVPELDGRYAVMSEEGCEMVGNVLLLFAMAVHARYTILDAQGGLSPKVKKKAAKAEKATKSESKKEKEPSGKQAAVAPPAKRSWFGRAAVDAPHTSPPAPAAKTLENSKSGKSAAPKPAARPAQSDEGDYEDDAATRTARKQRSPANEEDYDFEADRRMSKAQRKALRRQKDRSRGDMNDE